MSPTGNRETRRVIAGLLTLALAGCDACEPWPEPEPVTASSLDYIVAIPNELEIQVDDPTKDLEVMVVGRVYDTNHNPRIGEPLQFSISPMGAGVDKSDIGTDMTKLVVRATATPTDKDFTVTVAHAASGLPPVSIPVHVRYPPPTVHGVGVPVGSVDEWPMAGLASGEADKLWHSNVLKAFVRRARFGTFDPTGIAPVGDVASGTVLSPAHVAWRKEGPWVGSTGDVTVPSTAGSVPASIPFIPVFLADNSPGPTGTPSDRFVIDLQGGADIIESSLVGVRVEIGSVVFGPRMTWDANCQALGQKLKALSPNLRPDPSRLMVYMVDRANGSISDKPYECDPTNFQGTFSAHAIFLPVGAVESQSVAHEIGHAFSLKHASWSSGFFHSNLMVEAVTGMGALRDRLSVGQAFRAALDKNSWLVLAGKNKSASLDCSGINPMCPRLSDDIVARMPP